MPEFSDTPPAAHQISLLLHTAVDFGLNSGVGIGIIQSTAPARSKIRRKCTATRIKVQSIMVLCSLPAVVELIKHHQAHGPNSLESVVSKEDRSMIRRVLATVRRLSRYDVQVSIVENGAEGDIGKATRAKMIASHRKKRLLRRRRHERRIMSKKCRDGG
ncbi:hypothetical protein COCCADRAFT_29422 [Bipolaris zeicola 26-R-13]|uniref:Uncharacterized protein n=1 Tax=Cochliobolus carbonum (strain 26-R-13) TaxID=930089 RepID=W6XUR8_COCC2|nr:uncharacterized protein COCCADRAFT_29422 [Bipolaris zeicola 26-R-13]EUC29503.1 hypothetical protein COCCADRAFT_29422 [Bipolaris zeicola 26-R-13]